MTPTNPSFDIAHLAHVEMLTDRFDESLDFFTRVFGLKLSGQDENSAYLRAWEDGSARAIALDPDAPSPWRKARAWERAWKAAAR